MYVYVCVCGGGDLRCERIRIAPPPPPPPPKENVTQVIVIHMDILRGQVGGGGGNLSGLFVFLLEGEKGRSCRGDHDNRPHCLDVR